MSTLRMMGLTVCSMMALNAPLLAQVHESPGAPSEQGPVFSWAVATVLFLAVLIASMKSSKRSHQD